MRFMELPPLKENQYYYDNSNLGEKPNWVIRNGALESIDPNILMLFGYTEKEFLAKQY